MAKYNFLGSKRLGDKTGSLRLQNGDVLQRGGDSVEVDDKELELLKAAGFRFRKDSDSAEGAEEDENSEGNPPVSETSDQQRAQREDSGVQSATVEESSKRGVFGGRN